MILRLFKGEASVSEIAEPFLEQMSLPAVTKHLQVLERAGLVVKTQDTQRRICSLNLEGLKEANEFMEQYRFMWEQSLDRLDSYLKSANAKKQSSTRSPTNGRKKQSK